MKSKLLESRNDLIKALRTAKVMSVRCGLSTRKDGYGTDIIRKQIVLEILGKHVTVHGDTRNQVLCAFGDVTHTLTSAESRRFNELMHRIGEALNADPAYVAIRSHQAECRRVKLFGRNINEVAKGALEHGVSLDELQEQVEKAYAHYTAFQVMNM